MGIPTPTPKPTQTVSPPPQSVVCGPGGPKDTGTKGLDRAQSTQEPHPPGTPSPSDPEPRAPRLAQMGIRTCAERGRAHDFRPTGGKRAAGTPGPARPGCPAPSRLRLNPRSEIAPGNPRAGRVLTRSREGRHGGVPREEGSARPGLEAADSLPEGSYPRGTQARSRAGSAPAAPPRSGPGVSGSGVPDSPPRAPGAPGQPSVARPSRIRAPGSLEPESRAGRPWRAGRAGAPDSAPEPLSLGAQSRRDRVPGRAATPPGVPRGAPRPGTLHAEP